MDELGKKLHLPDDEFQENVGISKPETDAPMAVMCRRGNRAQTAQLALMGAGYTNVR